MSVGRDHGADLDQMRLHGLGVAPGHDEPGALAFGRADRPKDIGPLRALIMRCAGPGPATSPSAGDLVLLADPRFILKPQLYALAVGLALLDLRHAGGKVFLNASAAAGSWS